MNDMISEASHARADATCGPAAPRRLTIIRSVTSVSICVAVGVIVGWIAFQLEQTGKLPRFLFPLVFPLLVGAIAGALSVPAMRFVNRMNRRWSSAAALFAGVIVVSTQ